MKQRPWKYSRGYVQKSLKFVRKVVSQVRIWVFLGQMLDQGTQKWKENTFLHFKFRGNIFNTIVLKICFKT
jgi:hypothetical protein